MFFVNLFVIPNTDSDAITFANVPKTKEKHQSLNNLLVKCKSQVLIKMISSYAHSSHS